MFDLGSQETHDMYKAKNMLLEQQLKKKYQQSEIPENSRNGLTLPKLAKNEDYEQNDEIIYNSNFAFGQTLISKTNSNLSQFMTKNQHKQTLKYPTK